MEDFWLAVSINKLVRRGAGVIEWLQRGTNSDATAIDDEELRKICAA
jgi:hypothetical protein